MATNGYSPIKQLAAGGTKSGKGNIFTKRGRKQRKLNKHAKELAFENYEFNNPKKSPVKQTDGTSKSKRQVNEQKIHPTEYWYKINGKPCTKAQYNAYQNKPGGVEPGKSTNDPDASGNKAKIANNRANNKASKRPTALTEEQTEIKNQGTN